MKKRSLYTALLAMLPFIVAVPVYANAFDSGKCGKNLNWEYSGNGDSLTLTISGKGEMYDYDDEEHGMDDSPWHKNYRLKKLVVKEGVTRIGEEAFEDCNNLESAVLPLSLKRINEEAFEDCYGLQKIYYAGTGADFDNIWIEKDNEALFRAELVTSWSGNELEGGGGKEGSNEGEGRKKPERGGEKAPQELPDGTFFKGEKIFPGTELFSGISGISGYSVDDKSVARLDRRFRLKMKKAGITTVRAFDSEGKELSAAVITVVSKPKLKFRKKVSRNEGFIDAYDYLSVKSLGRIKADRWYSSRPSVASIDDNGWITVNKKGQTKITALIGNTKISAKLKVR